MPDVVDEVGSLWVCVPGETTMLPAVGRSALPGEAIDLVFDRAMGRTSLRVHVAVPPELPEGLLSVRLWQQASGLGVHLVPLGRDASTERFGRDDVPAGSYRLELHCPGFGAVDAGTHSLPGEGRVVLDRLALPAATKVTFVAGASGAPADREWELVRRLPAADHSLEAQQGFAGPHRLSRGDYQLHWRDRAGRTRRHRFVLDGSADELRITLP